MNVLIYIVILVLVIHFICKSEGFENLKNFITSTNNGKWNLIDFNPFTSIKSFNDNFVLNYDTNKLKNSIPNIKNYTLKEQYEEMSKRLDKIKNDYVININMKSILTKYINSTESIKINKRSIYKSGIKYEYSVPLITDLEKKTYEQKKINLKTMIGSSLIDDLIKLEIGSYIKCELYEQYISETKNYTIHCKISPIFAKL